MTARFPRLPLSAAKFCLSLGAGLMALGSLVAAPYPPEGLPTQWVQPDGTTLNLRVFGDELYARTTTEEGYTVLFNDADKTYYYAAQAQAGQPLANSGVPAGKPPPVEAGIHLQEPKELQAAVRKASIEKYVPDRAARWEARVKAVQAQRAQAAAAGKSSTAFAPGDDPEAAPVNGSKVGLMILVQFPDDPATTAADAVNFPAPQAKMVRMANEPGYTDDGNTGSVRDYFYDQSGTQLTHTQLVTTVVTLSQPRNYYNYSDYPTNSTLRDAGAAGRLLVADAVTKLTAGGFNFTSLSLDGSNYVYATSLLFAGPDSGVWAKGLWPHAWSMSPAINVGTAGSPIRIFRYQCTNVSSAAPVIGTICHELGHLLLGYPDLYDTNGGSEGVGQHCLMGSANHLNGGRTPGPINLYLKDFSGWANITDLTPTQVLDAVLPTTGNVGYRIRKPGTPTEYFVVENRGAGDKWAASSPDKGIAIWHIDETVSTNQAQQMTPTQHYKVSIQQADGAFDLENNRDRGDSFDFYDINTQGFDNYSAPNAHWWSGVASDISIKAQSAPGANMSVSFGAAVTTGLAVNPASQNVQDSGGSAAFDVLATVPWTWTVDSAWVTSTEPVSQTGDQLFNYTVAANPSPTARTATIRVTGNGITRTHVILQAGLDDHGDSTGTATVISQNSSTPGIIGAVGDVDYFRIDVVGTGPLTLQTSGLLDTYGTLMNSTGSVLAQDDDSAGVGNNFRITWSVTNGTYYLQVSPFDIGDTGAYQLSCVLAGSAALTVAPVSQNAVVAGGSHSFAVTSNASWTWSVNAPWVTSNEAAPQSGSQTFSYTVGSNPDSTSRSAVITLNAGGLIATHTVNQAGISGVDDHGNTTATATVVSQNSATPGVIGLPGDIDMFRINVNTTGPLIVRTTGILDSFGSLLDSAGNVLQTDDDRGTDSNFLISRAVTPGVYYVRVAHFDSVNGTGGYFLECSLAIPNVKAGPVINPVNGHTYYVSHPSSWAGCEARAVALGGHLATINDAQEQAWIMTNFSFHGALWTGLSDAAQEGAFQWASGGNTSYNNWEGGNPTGGEGTDFVMIHPPTSGSALEGYWDDTDIFAAEVDDVPPFGLIEVPGPAITAQPSSAVLSAGQTATLTVAAAGTGLSYQWYKGPSGITAVPVGTDSPSFTTPVIGVTSFYWVKITGPTGAFTFSDTATLTLNVPATPEIVVQSPVHVDLVKNQQCNFGSVGVKAQKFMTITLFNGGNASLEGVSATLDGLGAGSYAIVTPPASSIAPQAATSILIRCSPLVLGDHTAGLHIFSNDTGDSPFDLVLRSNGVKKETIAVRVLGPTAISHDSATVRAALDPKGAEFDITMEYGPDNTSYPNILPASPATVSGTGSKDLFATLPGLQPHTKYFYRFRAQGAIGSGVSAGLSFTTRNRNPVALPESIRVLPGATVVLDVLSNDTDPDGDVLTVASATPVAAASGKLVLSKGVLTFTAPAAGFFGVNFSYDVKDNFGGKATAYVSLITGDCDIAPPSKDLKAAGGTYEIVVTSDGSWSVLEALNWVSAAPASQTGNGSTLITVQPNTAKAPRTATINIGGKTHTISQEGVLLPDLTMPASIPPAIVSGDYFLQIPTTNAPVIYTVSLPPGLAMNQSTGLISGKPTKPGTFPVVVKARNAAGPAPTTLQFNIIVAALDEGAVGTFHGHLAGHPVLNAGMGSRFEMTSTSAGALTGKIITGTTATSFTGKLDATTGDPLHPTATITLPRKNLTPLVLTLALDADADLVAGLFSDSGAQGGASLQGWRQVWRTGTPAASYKGLHNLQVLAQLPGTGPGIVPPGHGYAAFTVNETTGALTIGGKLPDGSPLATATFVGPAGQVLIYQPLYGNKGSFRGSLTITPNADGLVDDTLAGVCTWLKPAGSGGAKDLVHAAGFGPALCDVAGGGYVPPAPGGVVMGLPNTAGNALIEFTHGGLAAESKEFDVTFDLLNPGTALVNKATMPAISPDKITLGTVNPTTGAFAGDFTLAGATAAQTRKVPFQGLFVPGQGGAGGYGYFLLPQPNAPAASAQKSSGRVRILPAAQP